MPNVKKFITVEAPVDVVYRAWRNFENFPRFMDNIEEVRMSDGVLSHWKAKGPIGTAAEVPSLSWIFLAGALALSLRRLRALIVAKARNVFAFVPIIRSSV